MSISEHKRVNVFLDIHPVTKAAFLKHSRSILEAFSELPRTYKRALDELFQRRGAPTPIRAAYTKVPLDLGRFPRRPLTLHQCTIRPGSNPRPKFNWTWVEFPEVRLHQGSIGLASNPPRSAYTKVKFRLGRIHPRSAYTNAQLDLGRIPRGHSASCLGRGCNLGRAPPSRFRGSGVMAESSHLGSPECLAQSDLVGIAYVSYVPSASWLGRGDNLCRSPTITIQR